ncbi:CbtA family protein [Streptomyces sp. NPDC050355]|uniref:CbtA family protein n=1 Tax=Streptomyces sirii TaxID=3127701 RepID=A0ABZ2QPS9_9ACTN
MNSLTIRNLLVRGLLAGLAAGVVALVVAYLLGEPRVDAAIAFEDAHSHDHGHEMEVVSRGMQSTAGLATGVLVYGVALGGIAALVFCFLLGRIGRFGARTTAALLSGAALLVYLVPFLKYPANPPAVGNPDTIGQRTALYFLMMLLGILLAVGATILGRRLAPKLGNWYATVTAGAAFVVAVALAYAFLPSYDNVPHGFPGTLLWQFRLSTIAIQLVLWTAFGLLFGHLAERVVPTQQRAAAPAAAPVTS